MIFKDPPLKPRGSGNWLPRPDKELSPLAGAAGKAPKLDPRTTHLNRVSPWNMWYFPHGLDGMGAEFIRFSLGKWSPNRTLSAGFFSA